MALSRLSPEGNAHGTARQLPLIIPGSIPLTMAAGVIPAKAGIPVSCGFPSSGLRRGDANSNTLVPGLCRGTHGVRHLREYTKAPLP